MNKDILRNNFQTHQRSFQHHQHHYQLPTNHRPSKVSLTRDQPAETNRTTKEINV